jgi:hypothetical protein
MAVIKKPNPATVTSPEAGTPEKKDGEPTKKRLIDICREGGATVNEKSGGGCVITGVKPD